MSVCALPPSETQFPREGHGLLLWFAHRATVDGINTMLLTGAGPDWSFCGCPVLWTPFQTSSQQPQLGHPKFPLHLPKSPPPHPPSRLCLVCPWLLSEQHGSALFAGIHQALICWPRVGWKQTDPVQIPKEEQISNSAWSKFQPGYLAGSPADEFTAKSSVCLASEV